MFDGQFDPMLLAPPSESREPAPPVVESKLRERIDEWVSSTKALIVLLVISHLGAALIGSLARDYAVIAKILLEVCR